MAKRKMGAKVDPAMTGKGVVAPNKRSGPKMPSVKGAKRK